MDESQGIEEVPFTCSTEGEQTFNNLKDGIEMKENDTEFQDVNGNSSSCPLILLSEANEMIYEGSGLSNEVVDSVASACDLISRGKKVQEALDELFYRASLECSQDGRAQVSKLLDQLKPKINNANELEDLRFTFHPSGEDIFVDIDTFRDVFNQWVCRIRCETANDEGLNLLSFSSSSLSPLTSSLVHNRASSFGLIDNSLLNATFGSLEGFGGDITQFDPSELTKELEEMRFQIKKLNDEISKLVAQVNAMEEQNTALMEEKEQLNKRLSCYQNTALKNKELGKKNIKLKDEIVKCGVENNLLRRKIDELKKENLTLISRLRDVEEELSGAFTNAEELMTSKECLRKELNDLNAKVELLEQTIELKEAKINEDITKYQENEQLISYWKTKSEETEDEREKLEKELSKAHLDLQNMAEVESGFNICTDSFIKIDSRNTRTQPLSLRQELEVLINPADNLPSPFCEKITRSNRNLEDGVQILFYNKNIGCEISDLNTLHLENDLLREEIVEDDHPYRRLENSDKDLEKITNSRKTMLSALTIISAAKQDVVTLAAATSKHSNLGVNINLTAFGNSCVPGYAKRVQCSRDNIDGDLHFDTSKLFKLSEKHLDSDSDCGSSLSQDEMDDGLSVEQTLLKECQNLHTEITNCINVIALKSEIGYVDAAVQCPEDDNENLTKIEGNTENIQDAINESEFPVKFKNLCKLINCWKLKLSETLCNLLSDLFEVVNGYTLLRVITVIAFASFVYYLLNYGNIFSTCSGSLNNAACGTSWSEILKQLSHLRQRPPHVV